VPWVGRAWAGARAAAGAEVGSIECGSESPLDCTSGRRDVVIIFMARSDLFVLDK
jgi:hypothetical protein